MIAWAICGIGHILIRSLRFGSARITSIATLGILVVAVVVVFLATTRRMRKRHFNAHVRLCQDGTSVTVDAAAVGG